MIYMFTIIKCTETYILEHLSMAEAAGIEPATNGLEDHCSIP